MSALLLTGVGELVTLARYDRPVGRLDGPLETVRDAAVLVVDGRIRAAGAAAEVLRELPDSLQPTVIDAGGRCVVPGLVDCHSHLLYAGDRTDEYWMRLAGTSSAAIAAAGGGLYRSVASAREAGFRGLLSALLARLDDALALGTTTVEVKSGYGLSTAAELEQLRVIDAAAKAHRIDVVPTFFGAHGVAPEASAAGYVDELVDAMLPEVASWAVMCDVLCDAGFFEPPAADRILAAARAHGLLPRMMADETSEAGAAELAARHSVVAAAHLNHAAPAGLAALAAAGVVAVVLPATRFFHLTGRDPDVARMRELGLPIALGTDHRPTSPVRSMFTVMALACGDLGLSPEEALVGSTVNAAWALRRGHRAGRIAPGQPADVVIVDVGGYREIPASIDRPIASSVVKAGRVFERPAADRS